MKAIAVVGPTASGKSDVAIGLAEHLDGEIVSVDSMQVYRRMNIGTAKPGPEVRERIRHHMIDVVDPWEPFTAAVFQTGARSALAAIEAAGKTPIIVGGSGLHFRSVVDPFEFAPHDAATRSELEALDTDDARELLTALDPPAAEHVDLDNRRRVVRALEIHRLTGQVPSARARDPLALAVRDYRPVVAFVGIGLDPGDDLPGRVESRFDAMLAAGLLDEVAGLADLLGTTAREAVGYKQLLPVVSGRESLESGRAAALGATLAFAKRQRTYFRRDPRIRWLPWEADAERRLAGALRAVEELR